VSDAASTRPPPAISKPLAEVKLYVATDGNDRWSGTLTGPNETRTDGPFASVNRARDAARILARGTSAPIVVQIRGGIYVLSEPLVFTPDDSGSPGAPVTYIAYGDDTPVLSGGRVISGWQPGPGNIWTAPVGTNRDFRQLFVNGSRRARARVPAEGFLRTVGPILPGGNPSFGFRPGDILPGWANQPGVDVVAIDKWMDLRLALSAVQGNQATLAGVRPADFDDPAVRFWIENVSEGLNAPGVWHLDRAAGVVSYHALDGEDLSRAAVVAPALVQLVRFDGSPGRPVRDIALRGLTLSYADWAPPRPEDSAAPGPVQGAVQCGAALEATGAQGITVEKCSFSHLGQYAVALGRGSRGNRVVANEMSDLGAGGIKIGDARSSVIPKIPPQRGAEVGLYHWPTDPAQYRVGPDYPASEAAISGDNVITDNRIHNIGVVFPSAAAIWVGQSPTNVIAHNEIHDTYAAGISCGWTWGFGPTVARNNVIEFNRLHHIGRGLLSGLGAIYLLGVQPGTVVRNNIVHDVSRANAPGGYGGWGIYLDATTSAVTVENNLVYRTQDGALHQNAGEGNLIANNIFALGDEAQIVRSRAARGMSFTFEHNLIYWERGDLLRIRPGEGGVMFDHNLYWHVGGGAVVFGTERGGAIPWRQWQERGQDKESLIADPGFADPARGDFMLRPDSAAFKLGFKPIDFSAVGPRG